VSFRGNSRHLSARIGRRWRVSVRSGDNHVRSALIENEERIRQALRGIKAMLAKGVVVS
jgi:hypothetical protein